MAPFTGTTLLALSATCAFVDNEKYSKNTLSKNLILKSLKPANSCLPVLVIQYFGN
jgi:hypothetical protein